MKTLKSDPPDTVSTPRFSVIIPARNDAAALGRTLDYLGGLVRNGAVEVIVAASGDADGTERSIPGSGRLPGGGNGNPPQYSCQKNPMNRGAWSTTVHGVAKSRTQLSNNMKTVS